MEEGLSKILELAVGQGIWAVLYIYLFFRMLKAAVLARAMVGMKKATLKV